LGEASAGGWEAGPKGGNVSWLPLGPQRWSETGPNISGVGVALCGLIMTGDVIFASFVWQVFGAAWKFARITDGTIQLTKTNWALA